MEFLDEDAKPRFLLQSKQQPLPQSNSDPLTQTRSLHRPGIIIPVCLSLLFLSLSFLYFTSEPSRSIFIWLSLSFLVGPFAPLSVTAGDIRVGVGSPIQDPVTQDVSDTEPDSKKSNRRSKPIKKNVDFEPLVATHCDPKTEKINGSVGNFEKVNGSVGNFENVNGSVGNLKKSGESVWNEEDVELLRKLMGKNPVGKPGRWEAITEGLKGNYRVDNVIKKAKELGEKKMSDEDSYQRFLKDRKQEDKKIIENGNEGNFENVGWTSGEDLALLNALKTFTKHVAMRWEKIAAAVPGKSKAECMKRVTELKKDFRSSKSGNTDA